jgi:hypothetical protein
MDEVEEFDDDAMSLGSNIICNDLPGQDSVIPEVISMCNPAYYPVLDPSGKASFGPAPFSRVPRQQDEDLLSDDGFETYMIPVHYPYHFHFRGEKLANMTQSEYYNLVGIKRHCEDNVHGDADDDDNDDDDDDESHNEDNNQIGINKEKNGEEE